ncbi:hypothetical protein LTR97_000074 [Elasticomyces elasticus]|uniref:Major facilitator superfamily (MFS) profile domain-containing protein n=1 Tax=Elasticomyces elasticus TaxID=574655 RepID=A0AAN7ZQR8_9PEZI|nr:hypothetical protein LTR97_000074 [Elasticomyces elasticus]KAK5727496.1 hypothetical protein LTR15_003392 [Elasticomyces elasticus]
MGNDDKLEIDLEKNDPGAADDSGSDEFAKVHSGLTKEPDITSTGAPCSNSEDVLKILRRDRQASQTSSLDSQQTEGDHEAHDHQVPPHRSRSRTQSIRSIRQDAVKVPVSERRGLFARFCIFAEVTDPYDYTRRKKWTITFIIACAGAAAPMGSSLILPALRDIEATFQCTETVVNLSIAFYMLAMSIFPLWWSSFSETLGRRNIYLASFVLFVVFNVLAAISTDIAMFIVMRCLSGGAAASVQAVGAGTIADIWEVKERGRAMGIFYLGPLCGPLLSPIIGGALAQSLGWRSTQYFLAIFGACLCVLILFCLPETLRRRRPLAAEAEQEAIEAVKGEKSDSTRPTLTRTATTKSVQVKTKKYLALLRRAFVDPLRIILYLQFPAVAISVYYATVTFMSLYMLNISVQQTFSIAPYNYNSTIVGLLYLPNSAGYFLSSIFGGKWVDQIMHREARKAGRYDDSGKLQFMPEDRMKENAWIGAIIWPVAIITYGWTAEFGVSIAGPMIANFFFGVGSMLIFAMATTMLTVSSRKAIEIVLVRLADTSQEFMPRKASNGVALNNFVRNIFSCIGCIVTAPIVNAIGNGALFTIVGGIALVSGFVTIWAMKRFGPHWRITMDARMEKVMGD